MFERSRSFERMIRAPRLTPRARWVFIVAEDEARRLGHDYIGSEHVLLALIREGQGIAARVLESRNIGQDEVRAHVHILLEVGREDDSVGARILADLGSPPGAVAADVRAVLGATKDRAANTEL